MSSELEPIKPVLPAEYWYDERSTFDRLDTEPEREFEWFKAYCKLGRKRSYKEIAAFMEVPRNAVQAAAKKHSWPTRVNDYDREVERRRAAELDSMALETRERHRELLKDTHDKVRDRMASIDIYQISPRDLPAYLELVLKYERLNAGLGDAPKKLEISGANGGPIEMVPTLSAAERAEMLAAIGKQLALRAAVEEEDFIEGEVVEDGDAGGQLRELPEEGSEGEGQG